MAIAALSTENFGAAIEHMARYKKLSAPEEILHSIDNEEWSIQFRFSLATMTEPQVLIEHCFAWMLTIARRGTGTLISPIRVELLQPRLHLKALERYFGCPVVCGASRNALVFRASDAASTFVTQNAELLDMLAPQFEQELKQRTTSEDNFLELVRGAIQRRLTGHGQMWRMLRATYTLAPVPCSADSRTPDRAFKGSWMKHATRWQGTTFRTRFWN